MIGQDGIVEAVEGLVLQRQVGGDARRAVAVEPAPAVLLPQ